MTTTIHPLRTSLIALIVAGSASATLAVTPMNRADQQAAKKQISAEYKADKAACKRLTGNDQDVCEEKAEAKEKVAQAELEYNHSGKPEDADKLARIRVTTAYEVAEELCDARSGDAKRACVDDAKAVRDKGLRDAKARRGSPAP